MHLHVPRLEGDRRRRAIAISSQQYAAHKERQRLMKMVKCSSVAQCSNINKAASSSAGTSPLPSSTSSDGVLSAKQERRAQLKAELDEEYEEALDILDDLSKPSSRLNNDDTGRQTPSQLDLQDVAVMKPARRSIESEYVRVPPPPCKRLLSRESMENEEEWEMLDDGDCNSSSGSDTHDGHAVPPPAPLRTFAAVLVGGDSS